MASHHSAPTPDLRIVPTEALLPHEDHDSQRSVPLTERLRHESVIINPPIVAPMGSDHYVILDGANRVHAFQELHYPHMLVQVASYESGQVELGTWQHVIGGWSSSALVDKLTEIEGISIRSGQATDAIVHITRRDGTVLAVLSNDPSVTQRNANLRAVVSLYQQNAQLHRAADIDPEDAWRLYPNAFAFVVFPDYQPSDIIIAAQQRAFLPPGVSRHIVHGRAIRTNYPLDLLRDTITPLADKNAALLVWLQDKLANRQVRYYAEATYQFDE